MKRVSLALIVLLFFGCVAVSQPIPQDSLYLGQNPPGNIPKIFNLSVSPGTFPAERITISNDGKEIYYSEVQSYYPTAGDTIRYYKYSGDNWTGPFNLFRGNIAPGLSVTGDTMYFQNNSVSYQTLFSFRNGTGWSSPQRILYNLNSAHYFQETNNGNYYISSITDQGVGASDWCKLLIDGADTTAVSLGLPVNSAGQDLDLFVSKDESFMIVAKYTGYATNLFISYHKSNGKWTNPKNLGPQINFGLGAWGPYLSADNKYMFYTTGTNPDYSDTYIYWVCVDGLIDSLRHTNFIPYVASKIEDQTDTAGHLFSLTIPDSTFIDDDGNNTLTYNARLTNGNPLPSWLTFNPMTRSFSGMPAVVETFNIRVTATDTAGAIASVIFRVSIKKSATDSLYLCQVPPGNIPKIFYLAADSGFFAAERIAFSNDGKEIYYTELKGYYPTNTPRIKRYSYSAGQWTGPFDLFDGYLAPGTSVTGDTLFIQNGNKPCEVFISVKNNGTYSTPAKIFLPLNSAHYLQVTNEGNYFASSIPGTGIGANDWCSLQITGTDTTAKSLGLPVNTAGANLDFFVSRDGTYMILIKSTTLYISYHKNDGNWTNPKTLGPTINWGLGGWGPYVTPENKYLFYTTGTKPDYSDTYVYWARIDGLIDSLKQTNFIPYLKTSISNQTGYIGRLFRFMIPDTAIVDDNGNHTLTYIAKLINGNPLPAWLTFDTITGEFSGTPAGEETLNIRVTAIDNEGAKVNTTFTIEVVRPNSIDQKKDHGLRIFPNPSTGLINISLNSSCGQFTLVEIIDRQGEVVAKKSFRNDIRIDMTDKPKGLYFAKLHIADEIITRKVVMQ